MTKVVTLVPLNHPKTGEPLGVGAEIDVDDDTATALRNDGKVGVPYVASEEEGIYTSRTTREDAPAPTRATTPEPVNAPEKKK